MAKPLLTDELWAVIGPVLPEWNPSPKGGQPRLDDRNLPSISAGHVQPFGVRRMTIGHGGRPWTPLVRASDQISWISEVTAGNISKAADS